MSKSRSGSKNIKKDYSNFQEEYSFADSCANCIFDYCDDCSAADAYVNSVQNVQADIDIVRKRKSEHLNISLNKPMQHKIRNGFEKFQFAINQLPEINEPDIDLSCRLFNKILQAPIIISPMTGGNQLGKRINKNLAIAAERLGLAMAVGSQRISLIDRETSSTFQVRDVAPCIPLFANLGAAELTNGSALANCSQVIDMIQADGITIHLNVVQEMLQPEGARTFKGITHGIETICKGLPYPVIAKEVGFGISGQVASKLTSLGVAGIDVAGAGGTSWAMIEGERLPSESKPFVRSCEAMALSTCDSLLKVRNSVSGLTVIASGGIKTGMDIAKAVALGADLTGIALPLLEPAAKSSDDVINVLKRYISELKIVMMCVGARTLAELRQVSCLPEKEKI